jgi:hypothetical protein
MLLTRIITGSRQHGFATEYSDLDLFEIYTSIDDFDGPKRGHTREKHTLIDGRDVVACTLSKFMERCMAGSHQALDVMFAAEAEVDRIEALRKGFHVGPNAVEAFIHTIREMVDQRTPKRNRHALRVAFNLQEMIETGRYTPELSEEVREEIHAILATEPTRSRMYELTAQISGVVISKL